MLRSKSLIIIKIKYKTALMLSESEELSVILALPQIYIV